MGEFVDIVDEDDRVVRSVPRSEMRAEVLRHRAVYIFVLDTARTHVLAHQRASNKDVWPSRWDLAVGGVLSAGERYAEAAPRELFEEVGIAAPLIDLGPIRFISSECLVNGWVYVCEHDGPFTFTDGEVQQVEWIAMRGVDLALSEREWCADTVTAALPLLRSHREAVT